MQVFHFKCNSCGYNSKQLLGSADLDQVLTDANADYAEYRLYKCAAESKFINADIHSRDFDGKCSADGSNLIAIDESISPVKCPRCDNDLTVETNAPLESTETSAS